MTDWIVIFNLGNGWEIRSPRVVALDEHQATLKAEFELRQRYGLGLRSAVAGAHAERLLAAPTGV